jgi:hypothetical protein
MSVCSLRSVRTGFLSLAALVLGQAAGCSEDEGIPKLVEENGVWSLQSYDIAGEGSMRNIDTMTRGDAFLLEFDSSINVVTAAWCGLDESDTPNNSTCRLQPDAANWYCRCFGYAYEGSRMRWAEFQAGGTPPAVTLGGVQPMPTGESEGETGDEGAPSGEGGEMILSAVAAQASTYDFSPLPEGVFASDGESSRYRMQQKAPRLFDEVSCTPCVAD